MLNNQDIIKPKIIITKSNEQINHGESNVNEIDPNENTMNNYLYDDDQASVTIQSSLSSSFTTKLYWKRYLLLVIFIMYSASNAFQWIEYSIISNIIEKYYSVSVFWVNCTSVVYMVSYIIGIIPASWLLEKKGLRFCILIGSFGTCFGSWIKSLSIRPDRFWVTMIGQTVVAFSQLFILNIPPLLAAIWFAENEVSRATAFGVFGNQLGIALGFFLPSIVVPKFIDNTNNTLNHTGMQFTGNSTNSSTSNIHEVSQGLSTLFFSVSIVTSIIFFLIIFLFSSKPKYPPSYAQIQAQLANQSSDYFSSLRSLITNPNFVLLLITYGLNTGVFYAVSTVLNQMVINAFGDGFTEQAGEMGAIITIAGVVGSVFCGYILDWTHKYKETTLIVYIFSLLGMLAFACALHLNSIWPLFAVSAVLGFFMTGYLPIGFEFGAEITYPSPEGTCAGLLNTSAQVC